MIRVGFVGTGFVARKRADAIAADPRARVAAVVGHDGAETTAFAQQYGATPSPHWRDLVTNAAIDLVMVCHINRDHGEVAQAALEAGKSVVVEYPLALDFSQAQRISEVARQRGQFLHVAHVELLSSHHQTLKGQLPTLGCVQYAQYCTLSPKQRRQHHWTFRPDLFGFPLVGAQSRIHRLIDCFGPVRRVYCQNRYVNFEFQADAAEGHHEGGLCSAHLRFTSGVMAEVVYGKGKAVWSPTRRMEVWGTDGGLVLDGNRGEQFHRQGTRSLTLGPREGLFHQDTRRVLDCLINNRPRYCSVEDSLYSLQVAIAAEQSAASGEAVEMP
mgnify:CR=1 FL=1